MAEPTPSSAGYFTDPGGRRRWWTGSRWTESALDPGDALSEAERVAILDRAVATYVGHGYTVESNTGWQAVVSRRQQVNVPLSLAMFILTGGVWLVVLGLRLLNWPRDRVVLAVDERGVLTPTFS